MIGVRTTVDLTEFDDAIRKLESMTGDAPLMRKITMQALRSAARVFQATMQRIIPRKSGKTQANIRLNTVRGKMAVVVGPREPAYYAGFANYGHKVRSGSEDEGDAKSWVSGLKWTEVVKMNSDLAIDAAVATLKYELERKFSR